MPALSFYIVAVSMPLSFVTVFNCAFYILLCLLVGVHSSFINPLVVCVPVSNLDFAFIAVSVGWSLFPVHVSMILMVVIF